MAFSRQIAPLPRERDSNFSAESVEPGNEISIAVPEKAKWALISVRFTLVASSAVATRQVGLTIITPEEYTSPVPVGFRTRDNFPFGINRRHEVPMQAFVITAGATQVAGETKNYSFVAGIGGRTDTTFVNNELVTGIPNMNLSENWQIGSTVENLQADDVISAVVLYEEFAN